MPQWDRVGVKRSADFGQLLGEVVTFARFPEADVEEEGNRGLTSPPSGTCRDPSGCRRGSSQSGDPRSIKMWGGVDSPSERRRFGLLRKTGKLYPYRDAYPCGTLREVIPPGQILFSRR
ncbi:hypothetical protein WA026_023006 [Henosepilachna vigintioctopunctata]|uniref:Uncharacterized protein n=1 Tax=Henosepilachna vigintioctopunctata TaxID=420089 RepID=A0AAW1UJT3_9CUCU